METLLVVGYLNVKLINLVRRIQDNKRLVLATLSKLYYTSRFLIF